VIEARHASHKAIFETVQFPLPSCAYDGEAAFPPPRHQTVIPPQGDALGCFEQFCTITTSYGELVQVKVLHSVKEDDPITVSEVRLAVLELLEYYAVRVRNRPTPFIFPISDRHPISFARRL